MPCIIHYFVSIFSVGPYNIGMFMKVLFSLFILLCLQSCGSTEVAEPVFLVTEAAPSKEKPVEPPIRVEAKSIKQPKKNHKVYEAPEVTAEEVANETNEPAPTEVMLAKISTDYTDRTYDLILMLDANQKVSGIRTKSNKGKIKNYPLNVLDREVVLVKAVGVALVTLLCKDFKQEVGCPIEIEYPSNVTYGKFLRFQSQLAFSDGKWQLESRGRPFTVMHLVAKKLFGLLIGVDRIELR